MALYTYKCPECDIRTTISHPIPPPGTAMGRPEFCPGCGRDGEDMRRDYRTDKPQPAPVWQSHFNPSSGTVVSDRRQLQSDLDRKSDELYNRTGIEQRPVVLDRGDMAGMKAAVDE